MPNHILIEKTGVVIKCPASDMFFGPAITGIEPLPLWAAIIFATEEDAARFIDLHGLKGDIMKVEASFKVEKA